MEAECTTSQSFVCQDRTCNRVISQNSVLGGSGTKNPKCICGSETKKVYAMPRLVVLSEVDGRSFFAHSAKAR
jgi:hypothetical protein